MTELNLTDLILLLTTDDQISNVSYGHVLECSTLTDLIEASPQQDPRKDPLPVEQSKQSIDLFFEFATFYKSPKYSKEKLETNRGEIVRAADYLGYKSADKVADQINQVLGCNLKLFITSFDKNEKRNSPKREKQNMMCDGNFGGISPEDVISKIELFRLEHFIYLQIQQNKKAINLTLSDGFIESDLLHYKNLLDSVSNPNDSYFQSYMQCGDIEICGPFEEDIYKIKGRNIDILMRCSREHLKQIINLIYRTCEMFKGHLEKIKK